MPGRSEAKRLVLVQPLPRKAGPTSRYFRPAPVNYPLSLDRHIGKALTADQRNCPPARNCSLAGQVVRAIRIHPGSEPRPRDKPDPVLHHPSTPAARTTGGRQSPKPPDARRTPAPARTPGHASREKPRTGPTFSSDPRPFSADRCRHLGTRPPPPPGFNGTSFFLPNDSWWQVKAGGAGRDGGCRGAATSGDVTMTRGPRSIRTGAAAQAGERYAL